MCKAWKPVTVLVVSLLPSIMFAACSGNPGGLMGTPGEEPIYGSLPSEKFLDKGKRHYRDGDYGLAEQAFRKAVEEDHSNAEAWLGLAASYDRLRRFDLADRAYKVVIRLVGNTPTVLNNLGYHYILRGDYTAARQTLAAAQSADAKNPFIRNNLALIESAATAEPVKR